MNGQRVTIIGGTGFLGRRLANAFADAGYRVRIAARKPQAVEFPEITSDLEQFKVDIRDRQGVAEAVKGASTVVNTVSLYAEEGDTTFDAIHVEGAARVARCCFDTGVESLVHISGIGSDKNSKSALIRAKACGEEAVFREFPVATIFRPSVLFGRNDAFISGLEAASRPPVVPLFGRGEMRLQPAWVRDVARAAVLASTRPDARGTLYELGGSQVLTYREAIEAVCQALGRRRLLMPFPMAGWKLLVGAMQVLPNPPLNKHQLYLLATDNTVSENRPGFAQLGLAPTSMFDKLEHCLQ